MASSQSLNNPWPLAPLVLDWLTKFIQTKDIQTIVECGSGQSTLHFAQLQSQGEIAQYASLEHDLYWYHHTRTLLQTEGLKPESLYHCPLVNQTLDCDRPWYDISQIPPFAADLVLIDGPPGNSHALARYPAPYLLQEFIQPGTFLLVDDSHRQDEQATIQLWEQQLPVNTIQTFRLADTQLTLLQVDATYDRQTIFQPSVRPKVSIVTTFYNRQDYLPQAIESVLSQSYTNFELILWDDGSTDRSLDIANHYAAQDKRIQVVAAEHQGRGISLAEACTLAKGEYIGLVDSDDLLAQTALAETAQYLDQQSNVGLVYTDYQIIDAEGKIPGYGHHCQHPYDKDQLLVEFMVFHFRLMRASVYQNIGGFNSDFTCAQDYDICLKFSEATEISQLKRPLYYYRHHPHNISCEKRIDQILFSKRAIESALERRGLSQEFEIDFQISAKCSLVSKS